MTPAPRGWEKASSLSLTEAAAVLGISRSAVYMQAASGVLGTTMDHLGERRVRPADLQRRLAERGEQVALFSGSAP